MLLLLTAITLVAFALYLKCGRPMYLAIVAKMNADEDSKFRQRHFTAANHMARNS